MPMLHHMIHILHFLFLTYTFLILRPTFWFYLEIRLFSVWISAQVFIGLSYMLFQDMEILQLRQDKNGKMTSDLRQDWNKAKDKATYYAHRAESKLSQTASTIKKQNQKADLKAKISNIKDELEREVEKVQPYWQENKKCILTGSALAAGSLIVLLSMKL